MATWAIHLFGNGRLSLSGLGAIRMPDVWWPVIGSLVAAPGKRATRSLLAAQLWPEKDEHAARRCLATALWRIKGRFPEQKAPISLRGEFIALGTEDRVWVDVLAFEHRASVAVDDPRTLDQPQARVRLKRALGLYSADLLRERDSEALVIERERLRTLYLDAAYTLAGAEARAENWPAARDLAQRLCAAEPLREDAQRLLMTAHLNCGSRALAIRQYHMLTGILFKELGVAPMPETIALAEEIGARRVFSNPVTVEHVAPSAPPALPMRETMLQVRQDLSRMLSVVDHALAAE